MKKIDQDKIKAFYNSVPDVWGNNDPWHNHSKEIIALYLRQQNFFKNSVVLNAGSAGNTYKINCKKMYHVDIASEKIKNIENAVVASIENLPFHDDFFDKFYSSKKYHIYISQILKSSSLSIADKTPFHIADGLLSKFMNEQSAVHLTKIDNLLKRCPYFKWHGNNIILHCIKK